MTSWGGRHRQPWRPVSITARAAAFALQGYYASLAAQGTTSPWRERMLDFDDLNAMIGTPEMLVAGQRYDRGPR